MIPPLAADFIIRAVLRKKHQLLFKEIIYGTRLQLSEPRAGLY